MSLKQTVLTVALATPVMLVASLAAAREHDHDHDHHGEHRQHGAHVHGIAALNLALEGREVQIELDSPAANILGFEHAPSSADDHAALDQALALLNDGDALFKFNDEGGCRMETAAISSDLLDEGHDEHEQEKGHDHQAHEGDHADEDKDEHGGKKGEGHDEHAHEGETHADIAAAYKFECDTPEKLTRLTVELFEAFTGMEEIQVQYVIESKQGAAKLTAKDHVIEF